MPEVPHVSNPSGKHLIMFDGMVFSGITPRNGPFLRDLLDVLDDGCQQATRLHVNGRSTATGRSPEWLQRSSSFEVEEFHPEAVVLQSHPLQIHLPRLHLTPTSSVLDSPRSCLDLFEDSLEDALTGQEESDRYDRPLMKTLEQFGRLFHYGINRIDIINGRTLSVDRGAIELIKSLRTRMQDKKMKVLGTMEQVEPSNRTFVFQSEAGQRFLGIASTDASGEASLVDLLGIPVIIEGTAELRPSGTILRIEAERIDRLSVVPEHESLQDDLRKMVEEGRVVEARKRIETEMKAGRGHELRVWAKLLELPSSTPQPRSGRGDFDANSTWLREHRGDYQGKWVALRDGSLIDCDSSFIALRDRLRNNGLERGTFCAKVED